MQLVERDQNRLCEVERCVLGGGDRDDDVSAIEDLVRKPLVLPPEKNCHRTTPGELEQLSTRGFGSGQVALRRSPPRGESRNSDHSVERLVDRVALSDARDDVAG